MRHGTWTSSKEPCRQSSETSHNPKETFVCWHSVQTFSSDIYINVAFLKGLQPTAAPVGLAATQQYSSENECDCRSNQSVEAKGQKIQCWWERDTPKILQDIVRSTIHVAFGNFNLRFLLFKTFHVWPCYLLRWLVMVSLWGVHLLRGQNPLFAWNPCEMLDLWKLLGAQLGNGPNSTSLQDSK